MPAKKVVVIGRGSGPNRILQGLKRYTTQLTALVPTWDASGAPGTPPDAGLRAALIALGADAPTTVLLERLFAYPLKPADQAHGRTLGSLLLDALTEITGASDRGLLAAAQVLHVRGRVLPLAMPPCGLLPRGQPASPGPFLPAALERIHDADILVLGAADFHGSVLGPLQLPPLAEAIVRAPAVTIFVCNLRSQPGTTGWPASRFIREVAGALGGALDYALVNSAPLESAAAAGPAGAPRPVAVDLEECLALHLNMILRPVSSGPAGGHDPDKLARTILFLGGQAGSRAASPRSP